jgi:hypothetical protein
MFGPLPSNVKIVAAFSSRRSRDVNQNTSGLLLHLGALIGPLYFCFLDVIVRPGQVLNRRRARLGRLATTFTDVVEP